MITTATDAYQFVERLRLACKEKGQMNLLEQLDDAMHLGNSGLEILGAIGLVVKRNASAIEQLLGSTGKAEAEDVCDFVNRAYGQ